MDFERFRDSIARDYLPDGLSLPLKALWHEGRGEWEVAHELVQDLPGRSAALIHAYLHRREGDVSNAGYWYRKAGVSMPEKSLEREWEDLVHEFLNEKS